MWSCGGVDRYDMWIPNGSARDDRCVDARSFPVKKVRTVSFLEYDIVVEEVVVIEFGPVVVLFVPLDWHHVVVAFLLLVFW